MEYRIGLDIGIGSVGWAVVSARAAGHAARIEDFGVRIFDSGENAKDRVSNCQERRGFRGVRRLERRRSYRKKILRAHFQKIGFCNPAFEDDLLACKDADVYLLKKEALDRQLLPAELFKCLVHTCNHRGYRDFYEPEEDDEEASENEAAANTFEDAFCSSGLRTVSEYLLAAYRQGNFVKYRNRKEADMPHLLIRRRLLEDEAKAILAAQQQYYPCLTDDAVKKTLDIIFAQRDFEDGPGNPNDPTRRYHGFLESLGQCPFYKGETRGFRSTVIADVFAVTNTLSQYRFVNNATGEFCLDKAIAVELVQFLLQNARLTMTDVKKILKARGYQLLKGENSDDKALAKPAKFLPLAKKVLDTEWEHYISEEQFDPDAPSVLHRIGETLSKFQTPNRRKKALETAGINSTLVKAFSAKKVSGTASCSDRYMCDAIHAFMNGEIYGNFQAKTNRQQAEQPVERSPKLLPRHIDDPEIRDNRVVFKAVNETRKIVNAIIDIYGAPTEIVVEVASELGQSFQMRGLENARQRQNEKENDRIRADIAKLLSIELSEVKPDMVDRYKLFEEQEGKCAYSLQPLGEKRDVIRNSVHLYEIDHIVPYSLILDNTLNNKALVFTGENQHKGQQTPLMYLDESRAASFRASVNARFARKNNPISRKKRDYFLLPSIYGRDAEEILSGWKSRNINDTRYITKYIIGILDKNLIFAGEKNQHVLPVKGSITQKFRREWFHNPKWGEPEKNRDTYLNHALDALVAANLTRPYIEIGSDAMKLRSIYFANQKRITGEYREYQDSCIRKMRKFYGFPENFTQELLRDPHRIPSYVPHLAEEVDVRFEDDASKADEFQSGILRLYGPSPDFVVPPHMPLTSHKPERKFQGKIADDNPIRIIEIEGETYKVKRESVRSLTAKKFANLYTDDPSLRDALGSILAGKPDSYTVEDYLKANNLKSFSVGDTVIRKVSVLDGKVSNFYRKENGGENHTVLGGLKYYCVEVYRNQKGETKLCGVRFVDVVKRFGKLWRKRESLPEDYAEHQMYLITGDYIKIFDKNGNVKYSGFYRGVENINENKLRLIDNNAKVSIGRISSRLNVKKYDVSILGKIGGQIRCSEPLPFIGEKKVFTLSTAELKPPIIVRPDVYRDIDD